MPEILQVELKASVRHPDPHQPATTNLRTSLGTMTQDQLGVTMHWFGHVPRASLIPWANISAVGYAPELPPAAEPASEPKPKPKSKAKLLPEPLEGLQN